MLGYNILFGGSSYKLLFQLSKLARAFIELNAIALLQRYMYMYMNI